MILIGRVASTRNATLKNLNLANCFQVGAQVLDPVAKANTSLTELRLAGCQSVDAKALSGCKILSGIEEY